MTLKIKGTNVGSMKVRGSGGNMTVKVVGGEPSIVTTGLVLYLDAGNPASYPGSGTTWTDLSGNGNDATLTGGVTYDSGNGGRFIFDGGDDYAPTVGTTGFPFGSSPGSISGWAKTDTIGGGFKWIFAYGNPSVSQARFFGIIGNFYYFGGYGDDITAVGVVTDTWVNICGTYDGTARLYINGSLIAGPTVKGWSTVPSVSAVGRQVNGGEYWDGSVAQVLVYDIALSDAQVAYNFDVTKSRFGL
jgi:hypothetical protein